MNAMKEWLKNQQEKYDASKDSTGDFERLPDGIYISRLVSAEIGQSKTSDKWQVVYQHVIIDGDNMNFLNYSFQGLEGNRSMEFLARGLKSYGIDPGDVQLDKLPAILEELAAARPVCKIKLVTKGEFQNTYVDKVLSSEDWPDVDESDYTHTTGSGGKSDDEDEDEDDGTETETEDEDEDDGIPQIGKKASFELEGEEVTGVISSVDEDEEFLKIKVAGKNYKVPMSEATLVG